MKLLQLQHFFPGSVYYEDILHICIEAFFGNCTKKSTTTPSTLPVCLFSFIYRRYRFAHLSHAPRRRLVVTGDSAKRWVGAILS